MSGITSTNSSRRKIRPIGSVIVPITQSRPREPANSTWARTPNTRPITSPITMRNVCSRRMAGQYAKATTAGATPAVSTPTARIPPSSFRLKDGRFLLRVFRARAPWRRVRVAVPPERDPGVRFQAMTRSPRLTATAVPILALAGLAALLPARARAQAQLPDGFTDQLMLGSLDQPSGMAFLRDGRLLIIEQRTGLVRVIVGLFPTAVASVGTIPSVSTDDNERGLLGI